jgi:hypothetical protein
MMFDWLFSKGRAPEAADDECVIPLSAKKAQQVYLDLVKEFLRQEAGKRAMAKYILTMLLVYGTIFVLLNLFVIFESLVGPVLTEVTEHIVPVVLPVFYVFMLAWIFSESRTKFSHITIKPDGLVLDNVGAASEYHGFNIPWRSPLIPWSAITYISAGVQQSGRAEVGPPRKKVIDVPVPELPCLILKVSLQQVQNPRSILAQERPSVFFSKRFRQPSSGETQFRLVPEAMTDKDFRLFVSALREHLPPEAVDPTVDQLLPAQEWQNYTTIWLQELDDGRSRVSTLPTGTVLKGPTDHYQIIERLGSGGQAVTYKAMRKDAADDEAVVVLKEFVLPATGGTEIVQKTMRNITKEAELLQSLDHPQIVRCFGWFTSGRRAYLALSLIHGKTLRDLVQQKGPLSEDKVMAFAEQMCDLLQYMHTKEPPVVHRDFAPDNLMVGDDGKLFLMDFDVARRLESQTATRTVVGKHNYMPPEQFRGSATTQSDIYALGCTLHWLLTGSDPEPISVCHPREIRHEVTSGLDDLVARATAQDCAARFSSAEEVHDALNRLSIIEIKEAVESSVKARID